jgi:hypothetical protein
VDKDSYYRGFTDACDVVLEHLKTAGLISGRARRELLDLVVEVRSRKAKEILSDLAA